MITEAPIHRKIAKILIDPIEQSQLQINPVSNSNGDIISYGLTPLRRVRVITVNGEFWEAVISEFYCADEEHGKKAVERMWDHENWSQWFTKCGEQQNTNSKETL